MTVDGPFSKSPPWPFVISPIPLSPINVGPVCNPLTPLEGQWHTRGAAVWLRLNGGAKRVLNGCGEWPCRLRRWQHNGALRDAWPSLPSSWPPTPAGPLSAPPFADTLCVWALDSTAWVRHGSVFGLLYSTAWVRHGSSQCKTFYSSCHFPWNRRDSFFTVSRILKVKTSINCHCYYCECCCLIVCLSGCIMRWVWLSCWGACFKMCRLMFESDEMCSRPAAVTSVSLLDGSSCSQTDLKPRGSKLTRSFLS